MLKKATLREIKKSLGRYIAIMAIVALGVGFFSGLRIARSDMVSTADDYLQRVNFYDYRLISTLGFTDKQVSDMKKNSFVTAVEGSISSDILVPAENAADYVLKVYSIPSHVNKIDLIKGTMPTSDDECLLDIKAFDESHIGKTVRLSDANTSSDLSKFKYKEYKVTGLCLSPLYLNYVRGPSSLGSGMVNAYAYIPQGGFSTDYFTEINVKTDVDAQVYSKKYDRYIDNHQNQIEDIAKTLSTNRYDQIVSDANSKLSEGEATYLSNLQAYKEQRKNAYTQLNSAHEQILSAENRIKVQSAQLSEQKKKLLDNLSQIDAGISEIDAQISALEAIQGTIPPQDYQDSLIKLTKAKADLSEKKSAINAGLTSVYEGEEAVQSAYKKLSSSRNAYLTNLKAADEKFSSAKAQLDTAKAKIDEEKAKIGEIEQPKTYVLNRNANTGYVSFNNDSSIINGISKVFPAFFFLVAALVCMTTMTRMVDEHRTQIGIFKALGYSNGTILGEYMFYAGSSAALGAVLGFIAGSYLFPMAIWKAYSIMYPFDPSLNYIFDPGLALVTLAVALFCSMGATLVSCFSDFRVVPAQLIRPKSPKNGKRIWLEHVAPIWKRLSFLHKVTLRNIFRYKKRFFMMVLGISGCTALLLTGFGANDSIKNIVNFQYDEIMTYDYSIVFDQSMDETSRDNFKSESKTYIEDLAYLHEGSVDFIDGNKTSSSKLIVAEGDDLNGFVDLHNDSAQIKYPGFMEAVVCEKLAGEHGITKGDIIKLRDSNGNTMDVTVSGICKNYIYDYIYLSPETCAEGWGYVPEYKTAYAKSSDTTADGIMLSAKEIGNLSGVTATTVNNEIRDSVNRTMQSLDSVIGLLIISAGALAFIVLYNLTNINITERSNEIATIKVLGFYPRETSAYVFRENFILTGISIIVGLFLGKLLHNFVITQIKLDFIFFDVRIKLMSYILSIILTFAFAIAVSIVMYFKLNKISMTESLKAIE